MNQDEQTMPSEQVLLKCLELEWQDHFQTRAQTWKSLEIEAVLAVALVGIDWRLGNVLATSAVALLLIIAAFFGSKITIYHRKVEVMKFTHIIEIEKRLGMLVPGLFGDVKQPEPFKWLDVFSLKSNSLLFVLRMHTILLTFGIIYLVFGWIR
ncbi:MAG: hypothetical protein HY327_01275 [Chloroflexi bacterium]|nr:hypothetical protein [Chloroflexota bacterium]